MKKFLSVVFSLFLVFTFTFSLTSCDLSSDNGENTGDSDSSSKTKNAYTYGESFKFDNLQITLASEATFTTVDNEFSDYYECDIIRIEATVKNLSSSSHSLNMFYFKCYAPNGNELDGVDTYFDDSLGWNAKDLASGASYTKAFYLPYLNDGTYKIQFDNWSTKVTAELPIKIGDNSIANSKTEYSLGETFRYHFFEIKGEDVTFTTVNNQFSDYYGKDIIRLPLTIKNLSSESQHLNTYGCTILGPTGVEADTADTYFDDSLGWGAKDLSTGASYTRAFYIVYTGDGTYKIEFGSKVKLIVEIKK